MTAPVDYVLQFLNLFRLGLVSVKLNEMMCAFAEEDFIITTSFEKQNTLFVKVVSKVILSTEQSKLVLQCLCLTVFSRIVHQIDVCTLIRVSHFFRVLHFFFIWPAY